jgi:hypothetical protein
MVKAVLILICIVAVPFFSICIHGFLTDLKRSRKKITGTLKQPVTMPKPPEQQERLAS